MKNISVKAKWREILANHTAALRGEVYNAVIEYIACGQVVDMSEAAKVAFDFIRYEIDAAAASRAKRQAKKVAPQPAPAQPQPAPAQPQPTPAQPRPVVAAPRWTPISAPSTPAEHFYPSYPSAKTAALLKHVFTPLKDIDRSCMNVAKKRRRA